MPITAPDSMVNQIISKQHDQTSDELGRRGQPVLSGLYRLPIYCWASQELGQ